MDTILYFVKLLVYLLLIIISGYVLVDAFIRSAVSEYSQIRVNKQLGHASKGLLLAIILAIFVQMISWEQQFDLEAQQLLELLWEGSTGKAWLALLLCSIIFCLIIHKSSPIRLLLVLAMLFAESINGHVSGDSLLVLFDFVHITAASIWVGGALCLWLNWREGKEQALTFVQKYTKLLWLTIAAVSISGLALLIFIVPTVSYLLYTSWGQILLLKIAAVIVALWLGYKASSSIKKHQQADAEDKRLNIRPVIAELSVLVLVVAFAASISMLNPQPSAANAINHHEMGEEIHYTVKLTPNAPGPNRLSLSLWTLEEEGEVQQVSLTIQAADKKKAEARQFILEPAELEEFFEFPGFIETRYFLEELNLPYPSKWEAQFTIEFVEGDSRQFTFSFSN